MIEKRLTSDEVAQKRFTPVRLREGYSMDEVDAFLDTVEATLIEQEQELKELAQKARQTAQAPAAPAGASPDLQAALAELAQEKQRVQHLERENAELKAKAATAGQQERGMSLNEAATASTQMLEMAARQHDDLISQGQKSSEKMVNEAKAKADQLLEEARSKTQAEQERLGQERAKQLGALEAEKRELQGVVDGLRQLENNSRETLRTHYMHQLEELKTPKVGPNPPRTAGEIADGQAPPVAEPVHTENVDVEPAPEQALPEEALAPATAPDADKDKDGNTGVEKPQNYNEYPSFFGTKE